MDLGKGEIVLLRFMVYVLSENCVFFDTQKRVIKLFFTMEKAQLGTCSSDTSGVFLVNKGFNRESISVSLVNVC